MYVVPGPSVYTARVTPRKTCQVCSRLRGHMLKGASVVYALEVAIELTWCSQCFRKDMAYVYDTRCCGGVNNRMVAKKTLTKSSTTYCRNSIAIGTVHQSRQPCPITRHLSCLRIGVRSQALRTAVMRLSSCHTTSFPMTMHVPPPVLLPTADELT